MVQNQKRQTKLIPFAAQRFKLLYIGFGKVFSGKVFL